MEDSFTNEANIFFDYNFPILTNIETSTFKTLETQDFEFSEYVSLYPNLTTSNLNISSKGFINVNSRTIYNVLEIAIIIIPNTENTKSIDVSKLGSGNYFIKIISDMRTSIAMFVKI